MTAGIVMMPLKDITPYEKNPRRNDDSVDAVANSIRDFGFRAPILVDKDHVIIAGHTRYKAARKLKLKTAPVVVCDDMTPEQVEAYRIADNSAGSASAWDYDLLGDILPTLEFDMADYGLDVVMEQMAGAEEVGEVIEDEPPEPDLEHEATVKRGEVYKLGNHFLMCGDSSIPEDLRKLMAQGGGRLSNMTFTDPPYGVAIGDKNKLLQSVQPSGRITENIENDNISVEELYNILVAAFTNLKDNSEDDASYYVCSLQGGGLGEMMMMMMKDSGLPVRHLLIWVKNAPTFSMGHLDYDYKHEPIMYTWGKSHTFYGNGTIKCSVWPFDKPCKCDLHPTMKPVALVAEAILNSSKKGDIVTDIFGGSGTTIIACEQTGRECRMMELDPHYCDVIIKRWEEFTGRKAEKVSA